MELTYGQLLRCWGLQGSTVISRLTALLWIKKLLWLLLLYVGCVHIDFGLYSLTTVKGNVYWKLHHSPSYLARRRVRFTLAFWTLLELLRSYILPGELVWKEIQHMKSWNKISVQVCVVSSWLGHVASTWSSHRVFSHRLHLLPSAAAHVLTYLSSITLFIIQYNSSEY